MSEKISNWQNIESESEKAERESLIDIYEENLDYLRNYIAKKHNEVNQAEVLLLESVLRMLKDSSISLGKIKKWLDEEYGLKHKDFGAIYLSEYARKNKMTNTEFLRGHLLARAQGEAVQKEIEKEEKTEQEKLESKNN